MMFNFSFSVSTEAKTVFVSAWVSIVGGAGPIQLANSPEHLGAIIPVQDCSSRPSVAPGPWAATSASWMVLLSAPSQGQMGSLAGLFRLGITVGNRRRR